MDPIAEFKNGQKKVWSAFAPMELYTCGAAARLVKFAGVRSGDRILDVACGTGVVALAAARKGARVTALDLTPELVARARENVALAEEDVALHEGDVEALPFDDGSFDVVTSQFGHMFAPRPDVAIREMLRVLRPGGTIAFSTWPPELYTGRMFIAVGRHLPKPPIEAPPPVLWGTPDVVRERLGASVEDVVFDRAVLRAPYLSPKHVRATLERGIGPYAIAVAHLSGEPERLAAFRREIDALTDAYYEPDEGVLRQDYLMTRAKKRSS
jgi:SAM-dependent methyltransferase